jgi:hypothetical protein
MIKGGEPDAEIQVGVFRFARAGRGRDGRFFRRPEAHISDRSLIVSPRAASKLVRKSFPHDSLSLS